MQTEPRALCNPKEFAPGFEWITCSLENPRIGKGAALALIFRFSSLTEGRVVGKVALLVTQGVGTQKTNSGEPTQE